MKLRIDTTRGIEHRVAVRLWTTASCRAVTSLKPSGQALFLHLVYGAASHLVPGLVRRSTGDLSAELRWTVADVERHLAELVEAGIARFDRATGIVFLPDELDGDLPMTVTAASAWAAVVRELPACPTVTAAKTRIRRRLRDLNSDLAAAWDAALVANSGPHKRRGRAAVARKMSMENLQDATRRPLGASESAEIFKCCLLLWNAAAERVRQATPSGRKWTSHRTVPAKAKERIRVHVGRLGRAVFLEQLRVLLGWAVNDRFWTELRHDGHASDSWVPTITSILAADKWDERVDVAAAATENHRTLSEEADAEDERERAANAEILRLLDIEREKIDRADKAAGGSVNLRFASDEPIDDPELISVEEAAEELIRSRRNGAAS